MLFIIAVVKNESDDIIGFRLLNTATKQVMEANYQSVDKQTKSNICRIENLKRNYSYRLAGYNGSFARYPQLNTKLELVRKAPVVILYKTNGNRFICSDYKGTIAKLDEETIIKLGAANGKIVNGHISPIEGQYRYKEDNEYAETVDSELEYKIRKYMAKCALLGKNDYNIRVDSEGVRLVSVNKRVIDAEIPDFVTIIGSQAFKDCDKLKSVIIPSTVTDIEPYAFDSCKSIADIKIPDTVKFIGEGAFRYCNSLARVKLPKNLKNISKRTFSDCTTLMTLDIPDTVEEIGDYAFSTCTSILMISLPKGTTKIGRNAFEHCNNLKVMELSDNISKIEQYTFWGCNDLVKIELPDNITEIARNAFSRCDYLVDIRLPKNLQKLSPTAFIGSTRLRILRVPKRLEDTIKGNDYFADINVIAY